MRFIKFHIENYRGIDSIDVDLDAYDGGNVLTLVGLNESGKTTVLDGIYFFQYDELPEAKRFQLIPKKHGHNFTGDILVKATLLLDDDDEKKVRKFALDEGAFSINPSYKIKQLTITKRYHFKGATYTGAAFEYDFKVVGQAIRSKDKRFQTLPSSDRKHQKIGKFMHETLCPTMIYYQNFLFDFPPKIYLESVGKEPIGQDTYRQVVQDILHSIDEKLDLQEDVLKRLKAGTDESKSAFDQTINLMGSQITAEIIDSWGEIFDDDWRGKEISIAHDVDKVDEEIITPAQPAIGETPAVPAKKEIRKRSVYYLQFKLKDGTNLFEIAERSLGFKWFFAFLMFTKFRLSRMTDPGETLFLLDEPASNLHPTAQQKLTSVFDKLTSQTNPAKLIFSTHSHHLIRSEWLETASIVQNSAIDYEKSGMTADTKDTKVNLTAYKRFVAAHPNQTSYFQPILDSLDYKPSELELVPNIVIVEGKHDFYTFKYMREVMGIGGKGIPSLYPGNGCGRNDRVIRLYEAWGRKYLVLLDSDPAGTSAITKYKEEIGDFVTERIYGLKDVSTAFRGMETEQLFTNPDRLKIIQSLEPSAKTFSKSKFNEAVKTLLFQKKKIGLSKTTTNRFDKILKFLAKEI